jgi:hypothetical protein
MNFLPGWFPNVSAQVVPISLTYVTSAVTGSNTSSYNFTGQSFGVADASRRIIVGCSGFGSGGANSISSVTIAGGAASQIAATLGNGQISVQLWMAAVPTGTSGDVVVNWNTGAFDCGISIWRLVGANPTPTGTNSDNTVSSNALSADLTIPVGGGGIGYVSHDGSSARTCTWTNLSENNDGVIEGTGAHSAATSSTAGAATRTATMSGTIGNGGGLVLAAWGP